MPLISEASTRTFMIEKTVGTFYISLPFDQWLEKFDNDEVPARVVKWIKVIFRGVSKENPPKGIVIFQSLDGVL